MRRRVITPRPHYAATNEDTIMDDQALRDAVMAYVYTVREALLYLHPADEFEAGIIADALDATAKLAALATE